MSMKKVVILAAAALTLVACAKTYELQETAQPKIGFDTWANNLTKARTQGTNTFVAGDDFAVYGYKEKSSSKVTVFDDDVVSTTDGTTWTYTNPRFWDFGYDKYVFYAVSPASVGTSGTVDPQSGAITSAAITFAGNDNDILVANEHVVNKTDGAQYFNGYGTVEMDFHHVASLVDIKVKKAPAWHDATVSITAFQLSNIENEGVLTVNSYSTTPAATWSNAGTGSYGPADGVTSVSIASPIAIAEDTTFDPANPTTPAAATFVINNLVVKPQTFLASSEANAQKITLSYKISSNGEEVTYTDKVLYLADFDITNDDKQNGTKIGSWEPGKHYTFYITIGANAINFSATISDWDTVSGYNYLVY